MVGRHRHQRQDHHRLPAARGARGRRPPAGPAGHGRAAGRRRRRAGRAHDPRERRPAGAAPRAWPTPATARARWRCRRTRWRSSGSPASASPPPAFTNLTQDHLDFHPDMEDYFRAKARLFESAARRDQHRRPVRRAAGGRGRRPGDHLRALAATRPTCGPHALEIGEGGVISLIARTPRGLLPLNVQLRGGFNVENVLAAVAVAELLEMPARGGARRDRGGARRARAGSRRSTPARTFTVLVDYAHTPDGLENVLALGARDHHRAADLRVRLRRRPRPRQTAADGGDRPPSWPTSPSSPPTTRASRIPTRSSPRSSTATR